MKGFFTQGVALLLEREVGLRELRPLIELFASSSGTSGSGPIHQIPGSGDWTRGEDSLLLPFGPAGAHVAIDVVRRPWPDELADREDAPNLSSSGVSGYFGPFTFPFCFQRACRQAWVFKEAQTTPPAHAAFIRVRVTYAFGKAAEAPPSGEENRNPLTELQAATVVARALSRHPAVVCYFNPAGEVLLPPGPLGETMDWADEQNLPPLDVWSNVRFLDLEGVADGWFLMDTVGMWQLDIADHEIFLPGKAYDFHEVEGFLRNVSLYLMNHGPILGDGDTIEGPGGIQWRASNHDDSFTIPPRPVVRWFADDGREPPPQLLRRSRVDPPADR